MATKTKTRINVRPLHDKLIVERDEAESITSSGIYLPESSKDRPKTGTVIAVGDGRLNSETGERVAMSVKNGDKIIFTSYAGTEMKLDGEEYLIMNEGDILAIVD